MMLTVLFNFLFLLPIIDNVTLFGVLFANFRILDKKRCLFDKQSDSLTCRYSLEVALEVAFKERHKNVFMEKFKITYRPQSDKTCLQRFANNKGADQLEHLRSLISSFLIRLLESIS